MTRKLFSLFVMFLCVHFYQSSVLSTKTDHLNSVRPPSNIKVTNISSTSATVSWDPVIGTGHLVKYSIVGIPGSGGSQYTTSTSIDLTDLQRCKQYQVTVSNVQAGGGDSSPVFFATANNYCLISPSSNPGYVPTLYISNVTVNAVGLPPMVSNSGNSAFTKYFEDPSRKVKLVLGSTGNTISVTKAGPASQSPGYVRVLVDFDGDGSLGSNPSEIILFSNGSTNATVTGTFSVPSQNPQKPCKLAMRIVSSPSVGIETCSSNGEIEDYEIELIDPASLAVNETAKSKEISIYPNPAAETLHISGISSETDYEIFSASGQKTGEGRTSENTVDIRHLAKGIYFIQLKNKENTTRLKFIKK
ncbi:fibronectin type III domain-containing protein [Chryseobacterium sp. OV279]|uniref:fibronectin type III domain-containing protein n=1 Tax=Chryseobacterium sp. OV279 TaxID=1500285 RepID=UPI0009186EFA|nr:T9SS type A sorting domain-containing protein [Chryseobacterium sp. OV279]SHE87068.1 Por secretion system C-terminal sorting domain-containing protein [Chryseobacterium sp. OV279]